MPNRNVNTEVWSDDKFTDDFTAEDKYFWLFLLTTRYGNLSGCFKITYNQIAKDMGYSKETAQNLIYRFTKNYGLISYDKETSELVIHNWYKYNWSKSPKAEASIKKYLNNIKSDFLRNMVLEMYENYKNGDRVSIGYQYPSNTNTISNTNSIPITITKEDTNINDIKQIVDYLNNKLNTRYRYTSDKTQSLIKARLNEGFTYEDFVTVIDKKYNDWNESEKMAKFLRPETLFSNKFESYLNEKTKEIPKYKSDGVRTI